jgi:hypothetical protein
MTSPPTALVKIHQEYYSDNQYTDVITTAARRSAESISGRVTPPPSTGSNRMARLTAWEAFQRHGIGEGGILPSYWVERCRRAGSTFVDNQERNTWCYFLIPELKLATISMSAALNLSRCAIPIAAVRLFFSHLVCPFSHRGACLACGSPVDAVIESMLRSRYRRDVQRERNHGN